MKVRIVLQIRLCLSISRILSIEYKQIDKELKDNRNVLRQAKLQRKDRTIKFIFAFGHTPKLHSRPNLLESQACKGGHAHQACPVCQNLQNLPKKPDQPKPAQTANSAKMHASSCVQNAFLCKKVWDNPFQCKSSFFTCVKYENISLLMNSLFLASG